MFFLNSISVNIQKKATFNGGVHPPEAKITASLPIEELPVPEKVAIPLSQHAGAPAKSVVKIGDFVKTGQKIGESTGFISSNIHSSVTGKVTGIFPVPHPLGKDVPAVLIEISETEEWAEGMNRKTPWEEKGTADLRSMIQEAGITGMGGAAFPTHVKLSPPSGKTIDTLIVNGAECEPYLTADHRLMLERTEELVLGVSILKKALDVEHAMIAVEENKMDAIVAIQEKLKGQSDIQCRIVKTKYPQGGEKQLIQALTGREVPSGGLPMDCGCVVQNVGTAVAVWEAVGFNRPLIDRVITVTGSGVSTPKNLKVRIGTSIESVLTACGGLKPACVKVISGGPMMGMAQWSLSVPVVKGMSGILCLTEKESREWEAGPCISCGACLRVCPIHLVPTRIAQNADLRNWDQAEALGAMDCIECGSCAFACPSKINLVQALKWGKMEITEKRRREKARKENA